MFYNQTCAQIKLGLVHKAIESLSRAIGKDEHLAVAYFQRGTLYLQHNSPLNAIADFEMTRALLRGNTYINYKPLGLYAMLSKFQILHNLALASVSAKRLTDARRLLTEGLHDADDLQRKSIQISLERIDSLSRAIEKDEHLAVAYFQRGTLYLQHNSPMEAIADLEMTRVLLRGNTYIDYKPLGLYVRLSSFQILHNLALANVNAKRLTDARRLLTEALHDADDLQRKSIQISLERIDDTHADLIPVMQVSADKVFTPPKSVIQNLAKKGIVRKAKVVAASNADDRSAAFEGSKRVRELKQTPTPPPSPLNHLKRFVKNLPSPNHSASGLNELAVTKGMKSSKSMSDLRTDDSSFSVGSSSPGVRIRRLFQKRTPGSADNQASPGIRLNRSCCELTGKLSPAVGNTEKTSPRSAFAGVKKLLNNKQKSRTSVPLSDEEMPVLVMRGSRSTGDLSKLGTCSSKSDSGDCLAHFSNARSKSSSYEKLIFDSKHHRNSLGSVFGDYRTVVGQTLSFSCDVLTAVVTPTEYENDVFNLDSDKELGSVDGKCSPIENKSDKLVQFFINSITDEVETSKTNVIDKAREDRPHLATRKPRPPPPAYPPPPLPPNIVINVG